MLSFFINNILARIEVFRNIFIWLVGLIVTNAIIWLTQMDELQDEGSPAETKQILQDTDTEDLYTKYKKLQQMLEFLD